MKLPVRYDDLSPQDRRVVREQYINKQSGRCYHCGASLYGLPDRYVRDFRIDRSLFPPNFFKFPIHLHHSHDTGMTLGAVHNHCNAVLWQYHKE